MNKVLTYIVTQRETMFTGLLFS